VAASYGTGIPRLNPDGICLYPCPQGADQLPPAGMLALKALSQERDSSEQRLHVPLIDEPAHLVIRGPVVEPLRGIEHLGQNVDIADGV